VIYTKKCQYAHQELVSDDAFPQNCDKAKWKKRDRKFFKSLDLNNYYYDLTHPSLLLFTRGQRSRSKKKRRWFVTRLRMYFVDIRINMHQFLFMQSQMKNAIPR